MILQALMQAAENTVDAPQNERDLIQLALESLNGNVTINEIIATSRSVVLTEILDAAGAPIVPD